MSFNARIMFTHNKDFLYPLYTTYGENFITPCQKYARDAMADSSADFIASDFYNKIGSISMQMLNDLQPFMMKKCYITLTNIYLETATLPRAYQSELEKTLSTI